jgi:hypothetical protein
LTAHHVEAEESVELKIYQIVREEATEKQQGRRLTNAGKSAVVVVQSNLLQ